MIIVIQCADQVGLVAAISSVVSKQRLNIISMREYVDKMENLFFMRLEVEEIFNADELESQLKAVLPGDAIVHINPLPQKKIVVLVTKEYHCLADILIRNFFNTLGATVQCVIGNHNDLRDVCERFGIKFHHVSHEQKSKDEFEQQVEAERLSHAREISRRQQIVGAVEQDRVQAIERGRLQERPFRAVTRRDIAAIESLIHH